MSHVTRHLARRRTFAACAVSLSLTTALTTAVATVATPSARATSLGDTPIRMTADTVPVTDASGGVWAARSATLGTTKLSTRLVGVDVRGTTDDVLYAKNAWGATGYSTAVPTPGTYRVRILTAEDTFTAAGQRVFDVSAENRLAAAGVDIAGAVGKGAAYDVTFDTSVTDGRLDLTFTKKVDLPLVSAIEVTRLTGPADSASTFDVRMTSRAEVTEYGGGTWYPGYGWVGPAKRSTALDDQPIGSTPDDVLYRTQTWGMTGWRVEVPEPGTYSVQLLTAEGKYTEIGRRVYDVTAEGRTVLSGVDPYKAVGARTAYAPRFDVEVTDGVLDLGFVNKADFASIASIRVVRSGDTTALVPTPTSTPPTAVDSIPSPDTAVLPRRTFVSRMVARPEAVTDTAGATWNRWSASLGSWRISRRLVGKPVEGTAEPELYRTNVWGTSGYSLPVSAEPATYRVRLLMAEDSFAEAGRRVFDVKAEGKLVAADVDVAGTVGINRAYDVGFTTEVTDGMLSLDFVKKVDLPMVSAVEVTSTVPVTPPSTAPTRAVTVAPDSFWTQDVSAAPTATNSKAVVAALASDVATRAGGMAGFNAYEFAVGHHVAEKDDAYVTVDRSCGGTTWTPGVYDGAAHFLDVPVPADAVPAVGSDQHMAIYDPRTDKMWSFWQMKRRPETGRWSACWGGRIDGLSTNQGAYPAGFGAAASGLAMPPGMVTQDEVRRGRIDHAVAIVVPNARKDEFSWPANRTDGVSTSADAVMQGQRLRLPADIDLDAYDLTPLGRMIAEAAKKYGMIPMDTSGAVAVLAQAGDLEQAQTGTNPWWGLVGDRQWEVMRAFPWDQVEALPKDYGRR